MRATNSKQELYHSIFGSILDRTEMTPYLMLHAYDYKTALSQATKMMGNRGFDIKGGDALTASENNRAKRYVDMALGYCHQYLFPFLKEQLATLIRLNSPAISYYETLNDSIIEIEKRLLDNEFCRIVAEDPRHLFLMASSGKYPHLFYGYKGMNMTVPDDFQHMACALLKVCHLIKSTEEDSQDINDFVALGLYFTSNGLTLNNLFDFDFQHPLATLIDNEPSYRAYVKVSTFFDRLREFTDFDRERNLFIFKSGDGVDVEIAEISSRLKTVFSMATKLGNDFEGEACMIKDPLAVTFILNDRNDTLKLFHALQKRGVILQETVVSSSITQTIFDTPEDMTEAISRLMTSLNRSGHNNYVPENEEILQNATDFYNALSKNATRNAHTSKGHKKFQCKLNFPVPIHRCQQTRKILLPCAINHGPQVSVPCFTEQHTLPVELRISDKQSWEDSEQKGDSHHDAYKFRQLVSVMNRLFKDNFHFPKELDSMLRDDQRDVFL
ncbi:hypothetical protein [Candidatus Magnetominusculus dajiuhuensis]|uniref:hypothetical protein n=1 Tax=Candidatus Magnetominusculus dajiuhuensis TaxID=3137712 RepID=UPI003B43A5CF